MSVSSKEYKDAQKAKNHAVSDIVHDITNRGEVSFKLRDPSTDLSVNISVKDGEFVVEMMNGCTMSQGAQEFFDYFRNNLPNMMRDLGYIKDET